MVGIESIIKKITFDIIIKGEKFTGIELDYTNEDGSDWVLRVGHLHFEENGSWNMFNVGNQMYDMQIFGINDMLAYDAENGCIDNDKIMNVPLKVQLNVMYEDKDDGYYYHTNDWLYAPDVKMENVTLYTNDGNAIIEVG